jgi:hypothetical protein
MATFLADSPPAPSNGQAQPDGAPAPPPQPPAAGPTPAPAPAPTLAEHACAKCGAAMAAGQDWCIQCGAGAPGSLGAPGWRSTATVLVAVAVLVLGAAAAAYAALSKGSGKARVVTVASTTPPAATAPAPAATTPATGAPGGTATTPGALATTPKSKSPLATPAKPPKIPLTAATPKASEKTTTTGSTTTPTTSTTTSSTSTSTTPASTTGGSTDTESIVLDTNAASPYNPYDYPASWFGDPSLAIDGDTSTAWTAQVNPATAPKMAEGLLIDLKAKQKVAAMELITSTPGMTVQVYGTAAATAPNSITDPSWTPLSAPDVVKKKHKHIALRDSAKEFTFITLWISKAPESAVGTLEAPGHVDVNEVELFPPAS